MTNWEACLADPRGRFSREWFADHVATKELLKSGPFFGNVLDVGCGVGGRTYAVARLYPASIVYGIDISPAGIAHAHAEFNLPNIHYEVGNALQMPYDDDKFDFVFTLGVIEHVPDTSRFLGEIRRVLCPEGKLFLAVTDRDYHRDSEHVHSFTLDRVTNIFESSGFIVEIKYIKDHIVFTQVEKPELKLNLGCGGVYLDGFVNIDKVAWGPRGVDLIADALDLNMYGDGTVDYIHTYGLLEHIPPWDTLPALREWSRVLRPNGTIHIEVPDLYEIVQDWFITGNLEEQTAINLIYGGNKTPNKVYPDQHHLTGFSLSRLASMMSQAGFSDIRRVESKRTVWALAVEGRGA